MDAHRTPEAAADPDAERRARRCTALAAHVRRIVGPQPHRRGMDLGTGTGGVSPLLVDLFRELVLVDVDPDALAQAERAVAGAAAAAATGTQVRTALVDLSLPGCDTTAIPGSLDVVYSAMALHHVDDVPRLLGTVAALLRPGGRLVVADLEPDGGLYHADRPSFAGHDGFAPHQLRDWFEQAGLQPDEHRTAYVDPKVVGGTLHHVPIFVATATRPAG